MKIRLLKNGLTFVGDENGQQVPELQRPWFSIYLEWLVAQGIDPTEVKFEMPDGSRVREVFRIDDDDDDDGPRFNWSIVPPLPSMQTFNHNGGLLQVDPADGRISHLGHPRPPGSPIGYRPHTTKVIDDPKGDDDEQEDEEE